MMYANAFNACESLVELYYPVMSAGVGFEIGGNFRPWGPFEEHIYVPEGKWIYLTKDGLEEWPEGNKTAAGALDVPRCRIHCKKES